LRDLRALVRAVTIFRASDAVRAPVVIDVRARVQQMPVVGPFARADIATGDTAKS